MSRHNDVTAIITKSRDAIMQPHDWLTRTATLYLLKQVIYDCVSETLAQLKQQQRWRSTQYIGKTLRIYYYHVPLWSNLRLLHGLHASDVSGYLMVSTKASCHDITCESVPGSPPLFLLFCQDMEEPGNKTQGFMLECISTPQTNQEKPQLAQ